MGHRHRRAKGGSMAGRESFVSAPSEREAKRTKDSFKRGGHHGLHAHGGMSKPRADKKARGGASGFARGGTTHSPFSSAARGNDMGRHPPHKDGHQPRKDGGAAFARGGRAKRHAGIGGSMGGHSRPPASDKHEYNFGHHQGSGHEEPLQRTHPPVHHKHGGPEHGRADGGAVGFRHGGHVHHAGHGGHAAHHPHHDGHHHGHHGMHGSAHKAKGRKHRADGGGVGLARGGKAEDD